MDDPYTPKKRPFKQKISPLRYKTPTTESWDGLDISNQGIKNISSYLFTLTFIKHLYINNNSLSSIPPSISLLKNLIVLDISRNYLRSLPNEIFLLNNLRELHASDNMISSIPLQIGSLYQLQRLNLNNNPLIEPYNTLYLESENSLLSFCRENNTVYPIPSPREWIEYESCCGLSITVGSYNILCPSYATSTFYKYVPSWILSWENRRDSILQQIIEYNVDILCIQEMDANGYNEYFNPSLCSSVVGGGGVGGVGGGVSSSLEISKETNKEQYKEQYKETSKEHYNHYNKTYNSLFYPKSRYRSMDNKNKGNVDGCAIFYNKNLFSCLESKCVEFNTTVLSDKRFYEKGDILNRNVNKDNIGVITILEVKRGGNAGRGGGSRDSSRDSNRIDSSSNIKDNIRDTKDYANTNIRDTTNTKDYIKDTKDTYVVVANVHLCWDPEYTDVKLFQSILIIEELEILVQKYKNKGKVCIFLCGDFNSLKNTNVYKMICTGRIDNSSGVGYDSRVDSKIDNRIDSNNTTYNILTNQSNNISNTDTNNNNQPNITNTFNGFDYGPYNNGFTHNLLLSDTHENTLNDATCYTPGFKGVIDYIFYGGEVKVNGVLTGVDEEYFSKVVGLPSVHLPSDHVFIGGKYVIRDDLFLFIDYLKLLAEDGQTLEEMTEEVKVVVNNIGLAINKGKSASNDPCCEDTATLLEGIGVYKYLGIIED
ncbi:CCR4-NOT transcription complex deadenylase, partial [Hamiltosporidium magnivora]